MRLKYRYRIMLRRVHTFRWRHYVECKSRSARVGRPFKFILVYRL
jgi:hypothetical protein